MANAFQRKGVVFEVHILEEMLAEVGIQPASKVCYEQFEAVIISGHINEKESNFA